jgi:sorting nexin-29
LRQGDSLGCLLFNITLQKVIRDSGIQTRGTIFYKSIQILAYADDIDMIGRSESDIKKAYIALKIAVDIMGLRVNEEKTKYMVIKNDKKNLDVAQYLYIDGQKFERVHRFIYLGSLVNEINDISEEIRRWIQNSNR